jgi:HPt (histidine-containing phosphotransfer) domain-containing protein
MGGNVTLYRRMLTRFEQEAGHLLAQLTHHVGDMTSTAALLHSFKGVAMMIGANELAQRLADGERTSRGADNGLAIALDELANLRDRAVAQLQAALAARTLHPPLSPAPTLSGDQRALLLENLLPLLESGSLRALDLIETLAVSPHDPDLDNVVQLTSDLNFSEAARLVRSLDQRRSGE